MKLFEPGRIGSMALKNRIVMLPINIGHTAPIEEAWLTQRGIDLYAARAKGGAGLIITTFMRPNHRFEPSIGEPVVNSPRCTSWLSELADAVHDYGARVCVQLAVGLGLNATPNPKLAYGGLVAPSALPSIKDSTVIARELTAGEIEQMVEDFEFSAKIIFSSGVDAIEIHGQQGYLLDEFMTPCWNKRTDKYGGDFEGRLRFPVELIEAIRRVAGPDYPISFRLPITHYFEEGRQIREGLEIAKRLETAGVNVLNVNGGCYTTYNRAQPPTTQPRGCWADLAAMTKDVVNIPVIAGGKLGYPDLAEDLLQQGKADFIGLGRYLLADPDWPNKVRAGKRQDIIPCLGCHEGCIKRRRMLLNISCAVNPATGFERELELTPATEAKLVLVVGGGPAGMEAARVAAIRGHKVVLWEKKNVLGGNLVPASVPDFKDDYRLLIDYLKSQIKRLGVVVKLEKEGTLDGIKQLAPDAVVVATGSSLSMPKIKGIEKTHVVSSIDLLLGIKEAGDTVAVLGGGIVGCELALYLAGKGKEVTVLQRSEKIMRKMMEGYGVAPNPNVVDMIELMDKAGVKIIANARVQEITNSGLSYVDVEGKIKETQASTVVIAVGMIPNRDLVETVTKYFEEVYPIGDCVKPRLVMNAMWEGYRTGRLI